MTRTIRFAVQVLAMVAGLGLWATLGPSGGAAFAQDATPAAREVPEMVLGSADAKVTVTEYASFTCPYCARFHDEVFKTIKADYIDTGKVRFVYREVFFDRYGLWAAMVARCDGSARYFGISDILFGQQREWSGSDDPAVVAENLRRIGRTAGMEDATLDACLNDGEMAQALVANYQKNATADNVNSTPSFIIGGTQYGNMGLAEMRALLDAELAK